MKNIIIIIGTVILGGFIVNTMIMGADAGTMQHAAQTIIDKGLTVIEGISYPTI